MRRDALPDPSIALAASTTTRGGRGRVGALLVGTAVAVLVLAYWPTLGGMVEVWSRSETFAHGFIVPLISAWLAWRLRHAVARVVVRPWWPALGLVAVAGGAWLLGELAEVNALRQFAVVAMIILAVPAIAGREAALQLAFPLAFLLFAVPFGEFLLPRLMDWTATFTVAALRLTGVPVYREGLNFVIPSGQWSVVEACSGVRYLIASIMVGTLFAYLNYRSTARRIAFVGVAMLVPLVANWLRAYLIVMLGHLSGNRIAVGIDHLIYGWVFFGLVMFLMFWIGVRWREDPVPGIAAPPTTQAKLVARAAPGSEGAALGGAAALFVLVALAPALANHLLGGDDVAPVPRLATAVDVPGWPAAALHTNAWQPHYLRPPAARAVSYFRDDRQISVYVAYYRNQSHDSKLISSENVLVPSGDKYWSATARGTVAPRVAALPDEVVAADVTGRAGERFRVWHWFWVDGRHTASPARAKVDTALARLMGRGDDSAVVVVYIAQGQEPSASAEADARLRAFLEVAAAPIAADLDATRERQ
jgi:exosortase A